MLTKLLSRLENPDHPLLGPTLRGLKYWGMWQSTAGVNRVVCNSIHIFAVLFVLSQYIELWIIRSNIELALRNLSVTMLSTVCVVKAGTFVFWQKSWRSVIEYVSNLEKSQLYKDSTMKSIVMEYTRYSRKVTYFYWCLVTATVFTVILAPLVGFLSSSERELMLNGTLPYPEIMSSWLPFERSRGFGYWVAVMEHSLICFYGGGVVANYDSNAIVLMSFFAGQLKLLSAKCTRLFGEGNNDNVSYNEAMKRIKDCHYHHLYLVKHAKRFNSLLSPVMFLYVIICSLMICASAIQLTMEGTGNMQRIWISEYLLALVAQLFLYCWHSNNVLYMSVKVDDGVYSSAWWTQVANSRRSVLLLAGQLRCPLVFTAGPFTDLSLSTFVGILKGSYSYYTLLSKKED